MRERLIRYLTKPRKLYSSSEVTNIDALKNRIIPGDVILVSGNTRKDSVVKLLTGSLWSGALLYLGDISFSLDATDREMMIARYGKSSIKHLVFDADPVLGERIQPLDAYVGLMVRHCSPLAIVKEDRKAVVDYVLNVEKEFDLTWKRLMFFMVPWGIISYRLRDVISEYALSESESIASTKIAEAYHSVGYPIRPLEVIQNKTARHRSTTQTLRNLKNRGKTTLKLIAAGKFDSAVSRFSDQSYARIAYSKVRHIAPSDYDLSRFFAVLKNPDDMKINYRK